MSVWAGHWASGLSLTSHHFSYHCGWFKAQQGSQARVGMHDRVGWAYILVFCRQFEAKWRPGQGGQHESSQAGPA